MIAKYEWAGVDWQGIPIAIGTAGRRAREYCNSLQFVKGACVLMKIKYFIANAKLIIK